MERKSSVRSGREGPSVMCAWAIFSTMVWAILVTFSSVAGLKQLHQLRHARLLLQVPDRDHRASAGFARHYRPRQRLKLLLNFLVSQRIARVTLGIVKLRRKLA